MRTSLKSHYQTQQGPGLDPMTRRLRRRKHRLTVYLPDDLIERARDAVYWTPGLTIAKLFTDAVEGAIHRLQTATASPFPARTGKLRVGRPRRRLQPTRSRPTAPVDRANPLTHVAP